MGVYALLVGPDGSGKTTITDGILLRARQAGVPVRAAHYRPGVVGGRRPGANVTTQPHERIRRGFCASVGKLVLLTADFLLGYVFVWRKYRSRGLLLVERGWWDMAVDPHRYRLHPGLTWLVKTIGRVLPRADIVILLTGDGRAIDARKTEIGSNEVVRQLTTWSRVAPEAGRRVLTVDTVKVGKADAIEQVWRALNVDPPGELRFWHVPLTPERLNLAAAGRSRPASRLYVPFHPVRRLVHPFCFELAHQGFTRAASPPVDLDDLCRFLDFRYDGAVVMRSSRPGRWIIGLCESGALSKVIKIGHSDDVPLFNEADFLITLQDSGRGNITVPRLLAASRWQGYFVVATSALPRAARRPTLKDALTLCTSMVTGSSNRPALVHGDFTPWNVIALSHGPVVLDWENARFERVPMFDLAHYIITGSALVGRASPEAAVRQLCHEGSAGLRHLHDLGEDQGAAHEFVIRYLDTAPTLGTKVTAFRARVRALISGQASG